MFSDTATSIKKLTQFEYINKKKLLYNFNVY